MDNTQEFVTFVKKYLTGEQNKLLNLFVSPNLSKIEDFRFYSGQINSLLFFVNVLDQGLKSFANGDSELTIQTPEEEAGKSAEPAPYSDVSADATNATSAAAGN